MPFDQGEAQQASPIKGFIVLGVQRRNGFDIRLNIV
jgi:hypothetical protein